MKDQDRVDSDIEKTEQELQAVLAKLARLRKQRTFLKDRSNVLFKRGMIELDEEDGIRSQEEALLSEQQSLGEAQSLGAMGLVDWSSILSGPITFDETVEPTGGSSSGV